MVRIRSKVTKLMTSTSMLVLWKTVLMYHDPGAVRLSIVSFKFTMLIKLGSLGMKTLDISF